MIIKNAEEKKRTFEEEILNLKNEIESLKKNLEN